MNGLEILVPILALLIGGAVLLVPLAALCARFALKPILQALAEFRETSTGGGSRLRDTRIELLENEVQSLRSTVDALREAEDFRRQLEAGRAEAVER